ncbi:hypothetical protein COCSUDRAFT_53173 [Coccomyxa subellipsoidea C-169]|uniref:DUF4258 domain-containing protein n=1 Tax=Coccomyxa subellipsoidea (strain C-169) TaxID=574566 RepID=I0Z007_COCSC|nr:hypothetical protein COCSUDRAFT_53173 [Coccomyxa subellipsoidea C-169]EIE23976.1 hypothetical protein COCSUDRAFT_53173 [Coccomyxa subellipsoidea C-169]|eukprot:XP_005648520.1 hypothetical protein COCSUDRAFT_53173 [Coccomyxa subellipsoidea C-169]
MPKDINPFRGKKTLGNTTKAPRRSRKDKSKGPRKSGSSPWGLFGLAASIAAAWLVGAWHIRDQRTRKYQVDKNTLARIMSKPMKYTEHAQCRMDCRHISQEEVAATLRQGTVNQRKSNLRQFPCPKYVVDATLGLQAKKNVQAVFLACPTHTDVVTVIDKDTDWECYCP